MLHFPWGIYSKSVSQVYLGFHLLSWPQEYVFPFFFSLDLVIHHIPFYGTQKMKYFMFIFCPAQVDKQMRNLCVFYFFVNKEKFALCVCVCMCVYLYIYYGHSKYFPLLRCLILLHLVKLLCYYLACDGIIFPSKCSLSAYVSQAPS